MAITELQPSVDAQPKAPGAGKHVLQAVMDAARQRRALIAGAVTSVVVSLATIATSYGGFAGEALGAPAAWALFAVNAVFTVILIVLLSAWLKPTRKVAYAIVVALGFQALISTDLEVQPLAGTEEVGALSTVKVGSLYNPVEKLLSSGIEDPIEHAKRGEIARLRERYVDASSLPELRSRLDDMLATDGPGGVSDRVDIMKSVDTLIANTKIEIRDRVRDIAILLYASAGRDVVRDLLDEQ